jgi:hypothetical protein
MHHETEGVTLQLIDLLYRTVGRRLPRDRHRVSILNSNPVRGHQEKTSIASLA